MKVIQSLATIFLLVALVGCGEKPREKFDRLVNEEVKNGRTEEERKAAQSLMDVANYLSDKERALYVDALEESNRARTAYEAEKAKNSPGK